MRADAPLGPLQAWAYKIPTDAAEADGTFAWKATTLIIVQVEAAGRTGTGYTYADSSLVALIRGVLSEAVQGLDAMDPQSVWRAGMRAIRNLGRAGLAAAAISALDTAVWDLKAQLSDLPLALLLGRFRDSIAIYGSGGFTSYDDQRLMRQLSGWVEREGCRWVKMKIGSQPELDTTRVAAARRAIGDERGLFVDANGAFGVKQATEFARRLALDQSVSWFEEPVSSDDLDGLRRVREASPANLEVAAGEYAYTLDYVRRMLQAGAVDVQQADASRCGGITGFLQIATLCEAFHIDLSAHCAPALHLHVACSAPRFRHLEWFHDHVRIEQMLFDGAPVARDGVISPDLSRPGLGIAFRFADAERFVVA